MRNRRFRPSLDALESRDVPAVVLAMLDTGAIQLPSFAGSPWPSLPTTPLGDYLGQELDFRSPGPPRAVQGIDAGGYGGHGSIMAALYALERTKAGGQPPIVEPFIVGDTENLVSDAIGRAMSFVAAQQRGDPANRYVVSLAAGFGAVGFAEMAGVVELAAAGVPLIEAAGNDGLDMERYSTLYPDPSVSVIATVPYAYANRASYFTTFALPDPALGTSGAATLAAAWVTAELEANPGATPARIDAGLHALAAEGPIAGPPHPYSLAVPPVPVPTVALVHSYIRHGLHSNEPVPARHRRHR